MKIDSKISFIQFVYPFQFDPSRFDARCVRINESSWAKSDGAIPVWNKASFPSEDLLPHVERYLNREDDATAHLWKLHNDALQSPHGLGAGAKQSKAKWALRLPKGDIPFLIHTCHLSLYRVGVGLLTICAAPEENRAETWLDFLHYFRFARRKGAVSLRLWLNHGEPFFPSAAGGTERHPDGTGNLAEILEMLLHTGAETGEQALWWREIFIPSRTLPFAVLYFENVEEGDRELLLYRSRCFFHSRQDLHPPEIDVGSQPPGTYRYAENLYFTFSLDGGAFIAFDSPDTQFFRETLPTHLRQQYFLIFLIALHQRFALPRLSAEVADKWPVRGAGTDGSREELFRNVRDALLIFTARGHFTQIMQRANHHRCYQKWQETFQIAALHREVSEEVREMHNYLLMKKTERIQGLNEERTRREREVEKAAQERAEAIQRRISLLGLFIGGPALVIGFLSINMVGITSNEGLTLWMASLLGFGGGLAVGLLGLLVLWLLRRRR